jgi:hypothetical protein
MGAALPIAAVALSAIGPVVEGFGQRSELRRAARIDDENARLSILSGENDVEDILRDERYVAGDALSTLAGSGLQVGTGSAAALLRESARQRNRAVATRREQAGRERDNHLRAAQDKRAAGRNAVIGGLFSGVSNAIAGASGIQSGGRITAARGRVRNASLGRTGHTGSQQGGR